MASYIADGAPLPSPDIRDRLSSWRHVAHHDGSSAPSDSARELGRITEEQVRERQQRIARMCLTATRDHDQLYAELQEYVENGAADRDPEHQMRVSDWAAFVLSVFEQSSALLLQRAIQHESDGLPREIVQIVQVEPPRPKRSLFQRLLGS